MRAGTLIGAIRHREPRAECVLAASQALPPDLLPAGVPSVAVNPAAGPAGLASVHGFEAGLVVFDTVVPEGWEALIASGARSPGVAIALVLRELNPAALTALRRHPIMSRVDAIIVPHLREEFDPEFEGAVHVGEIARRLDPDPTMACDILSTAGGGGHRELCATFVAMVVGADRELRRQGHAPRHLLVTGPRYDGPLPAPEAMEIRRYVPDLPRLMGSARVVVARAGYNTMAEVRAFGVPVVIVPGDPGLDPQRARARRMAAAGGAEIIEPGDVGGLVVALARHLSTPSRRLPVTADRRHPPFTAGAEVAASRLLGLAKAPSATAEA